MKKKLFLIIALVLLGVACFLYFYKGGSTFKHLLGGKEITEGVIEYDITYPKMDPNSMMVQGLPDKAYLRFKNNDMVNDMSGMMGLISIAYFSRQSESSVAQTLTLINKKYAANITLEEMKKMNSEYVEKVENGKNTAEIAGFKCKEAIVTLKDGEALHVYYTNDIGISNPNWSNPYNKIDGVLMDFQLERYGLAMHLKAKQVTPKEMDDAEFKITSDYKMIPFEELEKILIELNPSGN